MNMGQVFRRTAERTPDEIGIVDSTAGVEYTYDAWYDRTVALAAALESRGVSDGDRVGAVMRNRHELATLYFATQLLGAVFVPYNFRVSTEEMTFLVDNASPDVVFFSNEVADTVTTAVEQTETAPDLVSLGDSHPDASAYEDVLEDGTPETFSPTPVDEDEPSLILHTGGTTGTPKGVPRSHKNTYTAALAHAVQNDWSQGESTLGLISLSHIMGMVALTTVVLLGGKWVAQREFSAEGAVDRIQSEGITSLYLVPTVYHDLLQSDAADQGDLSSVRHVTYAGSSMSPSIIRKVQSHFDPETFVNHYGSTEIHTHAVCDWVSEKPNCVGRAGINSAVRVVEPSDFDQLDPEQTVPQGDLGEIIVDATSPEAFEEYMSESADERALTDGWFFTGDLGYRDDDGDLYYVGRVDDMIISGGENIYPVEVETVLESHDMVDEAAVVGRPSERWNQTVAAFVTMDADLSEIDFDVAADALDEYCRQRDDLADFKRPRKYYFIDSFTKSHIGKILRKELQKQDLDIDVYSQVEI